MPTGSRQLLHLQMKTLSALWEAVRTSFWAVPAVIVAFAVALALLLIDLSQALDRDALSAWPRLFGAGADGSRAMLSAIAGSMITVAGVVFSITIVALSLASSQYTSRVLRSFIQDRMNQAVLGVFVGIFAYCLIVLRTIRGGDEGGFVPSIAVLFAVALAFVGIAVLILFIHHIATAIQASSIIAAVATETLATVDQLFPEDVNETEDATDRIISTPRAERTTRVPSLHTGYIQRVSLDALLESACARDATVRMERAIGDFVMEGAPLASLLGVGYADSSTVREINSAYTIGRQRTVYKDAAYGIRQLVDVALKGLSPGVNDITTATMCVDYLTAILARLGSRRLDLPTREVSGDLRVIGRRPTYANFLDEAFDQIRQNAEGSVAMLQHLLRSLQTLSEVTINRSRRRALLRQLEAVQEVIARTVASPRERDVLQAYAVRVSECLGDVASDR